MKPYETVWTNRIPKKNRKKRSPIPLLAFHIASFNKDPKHKKQLAAVRANIADLLYANSYKQRK